MSSTASACSVCNRRCCEEYTVTVTGWDVWVIATGLRLAPAEFVVVFPVERDTSGLFQLDQSATRFDLALAKVPVERPRQPCIFLIELPGGTGRCGIHAHRPQVCQTYPAYLEGDVVALRDDAMCPLGAWKLSQMRLGVWRQALRDFVLERDVYAQVVRCWNERIEDEAPGVRHAPEEYLDFLMNVYRRLATVRDELGKDEWQRLLEAWCRARDDGDVPFDRQEHAAGDSRVARYVETVEDVLDDYRPGTGAEALPVLAAAAS